MEALLLEALGIGLLLGLLLGLTGAGGSVPLWFHFLT